jgi:rhodanese-related sulfurtransferase
MEKSQYKSLQEWAKAEPKAYGAAYRLNMIAEIAKKFGWSYRVGNFLSFDEARKFVHSLNLKSEKDWVEYHKNNKISNIPVYPRNTYKEFVSMGDWLGTNTVATYKKKYLPFEEARAFVHLLNFKKEEEWIVYCKSGNKPDNIPSKPRRSYKNKGWCSMGDWLGYKIGFIGLLSFKEAREFVHSLKLKNQKKWEDFCKSGEKPDNIPTDPQQAYENKGWCGLGDWLGTGIVAKQNRTYLSFKEAREFVHTLKLKKQQEWFDYCKSGNKPDNIPTSSDSVYKNKGWINWADWLGK